MAEPEQEKGALPFLLRTGIMAGHTPGLSSPGFLWVKWMIHWRNCSVNWQRRQGQPCREHSDGLLDRDCPLGQVGEVGTEAGTGGSLVLRGWLWSPPSREAQVFNYTEL